MDLEPGQYVLSFRWDSKCTPQVWMSLVHILLISSGQLVISIHMIYLMAFISLKINGLSQVWSSCSNLLIL